MREIKFRGKRKHGHEWLYGDLVQIKGLWHIFEREEREVSYSPEWYEVDPETVGQLLREKAKADQDIYERDIIQWSFEYDSDYDGDIPIVRTSAGRHLVKDIYDTYYIRRAKEEGDGCWVIGNIHENPELIKS